MSSVEVVLDMDASIAGMSVWGTRPGEEPFLIKVAIGQPIRCRENSDVWECPVELSPLYRRLRGARGDDSFHALCLTLSLVIDLLADFQEKVALLATSLAMIVFRSIRVRLVGRYGGTGDDGTVGPFRA